MSNINELKNDILDGKYDERMNEVYVDEVLLDYQKNRYATAIDEFAKFFPEEKDVVIFSAPGRSEVCGNHTDHQHGKVLATSINLDAIAVVSPLAETKIILKSGDMDLISIETDALEINEAEKDSTAALIRGVLAGLSQRGYKVGGFKAYVTSDVLMGAGMSSSAAFETLIGTIISGLYNDGMVTAIEIAQIGQYAENVYFGKPCGLMDQMACSVGGMVTIDFADEKKPVVSAVESDFAGARISLCIVDTKGSHADLTPDYAAVPGEMKAVAAACGKTVLREVEEEEFYAKLPEIIKATSGRAVLRAVHFYEEEKRVENAVASLRAGKYDEFMQVISESGNSSMKYLQNIYSPKHIDSQNMTVALAVSEVALKGKGVCRVHGGGFAGTIQAFVKNEAVAEYKSAIEAVFGEGSCHVLKVRPYGGIKVM